MSLFHAIMTVALVIQRNARVCAAIIAVKSPAAALLTVPIAFLAAIARLASAELWSVRAILPRESVTQTFVLRVVLANFQLSWPMKKTREKLWHSSRSVETSTL